MNLVTLEVELDHGRVIPTDGTELPERASALLTLLPSGGAVPAPRRTVAEFLERWTGAFSVPVTDRGDPRLDYLLKKHVE